MTATYLPALLTGSARLWAVSRNRESNMIAVTAEQVLKLAEERGIVRGAYVSWTVRFGPNSTGSRFGCVMKVRGDAIAEVQASNGLMQIPMELLTSEPDCKDAIAADQAAIYGR